MTDFLPPKHKHQLIVWRPKSDKDILRLSTAFLEKAEKLQLMVELLHSLSPIINRNFDIVGIGCCKACSEQFISILEDSLAISRDLKDMLDKADKSEIEVIEGRRE